MKTEIANSQEPIAKKDPWTEMPDHPRYLWRRLMAVGESRDAAWLRRVIEWAGTSKRVRIAAEARLRGLG